MFLIGWGWNSGFLGALMNISKSSLEQHTHIESVNLHTKECASEMAKQTLLLSRSNPDREICSEYGIESSPEGCGR